MTVAPYALALAPMQDVSEFARTTSPLTSSQKKMLDTFIARGIRGLESDVPQEVINSRQTLIQPLTRIGTSAVFREAFCDMFLEKAREIFEGSEAFNSQNAFLVLAYVRTGDSTEFLARNLNKSSISNDARRIAASSMLVLSLRTTPAELIRPRQFNSIIRSIVTSSEQETSWVVLQHDFEALVEIGSDPNVPDEIRANAIEQEARVLKATLERISQGNSTELARSISPIILLLRSQYISLEGSIRRDFVSNIPPALVTVIDAGDRAWGDIRSNALLEKSYGDAIYQATVLARLVAGGSRAPSSNPADYWRKGDRGSYSQTVQEWMRLGRG
jgi:hypothetical protein